MRGHGNERECYTRDRKGNLKYETWWRTSEMACDRLTFQQVKLVTVRFTNRSNLVRTRTGPEVRGSGSGTGPTRTFNGGSGSARA